MKKKGIVIHCSDSEFGSSILIDEWHRKERGWNSIGYHFVICNGKIDNSTYIDCMDGAIERGRDIHKMGAHAKGYNDHIGICLIGVKDFTEKQFNSLAILIKELISLYNIDMDNIIGHYQCKGTNKTCPNFDVDVFKEEYLR